MLRFSAKHSVAMMLGVLLTAVTALLWLDACTVDNAAVSFEQREKDEFIAEAQRLFAEQVTRNPEAGFNERGKMPLGEMTPVWQMSEMSSTETLTAIDVPLLTQYRYRALYAVGEDAIPVPIYHNLVVVKSPVTGKIAQYLHYYIPDVNYVRRYQGDLTDRFRNCERRGDYCGLEIYTDMRGKIWRINKFEEGVKTVGLFMGNPNVSSRDKRRVVGMLMGGLWIQRGQRSETTRATGSECDDWDWYGRSEYTDENGNTYSVIDTDGDGNPDSVLIDDVGCDGDNGDNGDDNVPIPDSYPEENDDPPLPPPAGDNAGGGGGGSADPALALVDASRLNSSHREIADKLFQLLENEFPLLRKVVIEYNNDLVYGRAQTACRVFDANYTIRVSVREGYNEKQFGIILAHEFYHIMLFEITLSACNYRNLMYIYPELATLYNNYPDDLNGAHHEYMARHPELLAYWLRELFPDEDSSFSNFGKWGSLDMTEAFKNLPKKERRIISNYLTDRDYMD